ncbi:MAG: two-component regulator propeller domain-containing protein [Bacteroidales bacterium]|nr:two-component regulator propeller domain-containing protein [Bacteroidales bacterium]
MKKRFLLVFLSLLLFTKIASTQEYHYDHYTIRDGLVQMQVMTLFQDSKGYLWIGTKLGASRFDGVNFTNYTQQNGLPRSYVHYITEDSLGRILLLTRAGLAIIDDDGLQAFPTSVFDNVVQYFSPVIRENDSIFIYTINNSNQLEAYYFDGENYILKESYFSPLILNPRTSNVHLCYIQTADVLYIASNEWGLNSIKNGKITKIADLPEDVYVLEKGLDGKIYISFGQKLGFIADGKLEIIFDLDTSNPAEVVSHIATISQGEIYYHNNFNGKLNILRNNRLCTESFDLGMINKLLIDREGNLWVGTEKGLYRNTSRAILNFIPKAGGINELVWSVVEDKNNNILFAAHEKGIQSFKNDSFSVLHPEPYLSKTKFDLTYYMGNTKASDGNAYLSISGYGVLRYDGVKFHQVFPDSSFVFSFIIYQDPADNSLLFGTDNGLYKIINEEIQHWDAEPGNGKSRHIVAVVKDKEDRIWMGGFNGLSFLQNNQIRHLPDEEFTFPHGANALLRDSADNIWMGSHHGLFLYDYKNFTKIAHPKLETTVVSLAMIGDSVLMIATIKDLLLMDLKAFYDSAKIDITIVGPDKGYHALEPGQNGFYRDSKGFYWLTNSDMTIRIDPKELHTNKIPPALMLQSVSLMDDEMNWNKVDTIQFNASKFYYAKGEKNLRFDFIGISLRDPQGVTYSHFLKGYDKGWSSPNGERSVNYTNLEPGNYTLFFKAANTDGVWSNEISYSFTIIPALHQQLWFKIFGIILAASLLVIIGASATNNRKKKQAEQQENEKQIAQFQLLSIKNQIDPHFTYNAINAIAAAVIREEKDIAYLFFVKLSRLMRRILQSSESLTRSMEEEIAFVQDFLDLQKFRHKDRFEYTFDIQEGVDLKQQIPLMTIQTFAENAVKHGFYNIENKGSLIISIKNSNDLLVIKIEDNGIGRAKAKELNSHSTGKGLTILGGYFDYFNRYNERKIYWETTDLYSDDGQALGTSIAIFIPKGFVFNL